MRLRNFAFLLITIATAALYANAELLTVTPVSCVYKMGDDLSWAQPGLDESGWVNSLPSPTKVLPAGPYHWSRCRLDLRPLARTGPVYLQIEELASWEAYVDGEKLASFGNIESGQYSWNLIQRFAIPQRIADRGIILVAIRETQRGLPPLNYAPQLSTVSAGSEKALADEAAKAVLTQFSDRIFQFVCYGFVGTAGLFFFILSGIDRSRRELLWLSLCCIGLGMLRVNELAEVFLLPSPLWLQSDVMGFGQWTMIAYLLFFFSLSGRKVRMLLLLNVWWLTLLLSLGSIPPRLLGPRADQILLWWGFHNPRMLVAHSFMGMLNSLAPIFAFWPLWRVRKDLRAVCWWSLLWASGEFLNFAYRLPVMASLDPTGIGRNYRAIVTVPAVIAMFFLLARRQRKVADERAELQGEMLAAQEMQRLLVPETLDLDPGIEMEVAYRPAKEVGGDFYFVRSTAAGQMVVIGDVSGKGLRAAMMASTLVGALRNEESTEPSRVLERLNAVALSASSGGFVTCLCALFEPDGQLRFANAGHILPYLEGREIFAENGLPLGLVPNATYEEATVRIEDRAVTLLSDGVLEAQNAQGELLGFERMAALTVKPAAEIADVAQSWGQEDDITVLTVRSVAVWA